MNTRIIKVLLLSFFCFSGMVNADYYVCWDPATLPVRQIQDANQSSNPETGIPGSTSARYQSIAPPLHILQQEPSAYAVEVRGAYMLEGKPSVPEGVEAIVMDAMHKRGYPNHKCLMTIEGEPTSASALTRPSVNQSDSGVSDPAELKWTEIYRNIDRSKQQNEVILESVGDYPFILVLTPYSAVKPSFEEIKSSIPIDGPHSASSGAMRNSAKLLPVVLAHVVGGYLAYEGSYGAALSLIFLDSALVIYGYTTGDFEPVFTAATSSYVMADLYVATLRTFSTYLESEIGSGEVTIQKSNTFKKVTWDGYLANNQGADGTEHVKGMVDEFIKILSELQQGSIIVAKNIAQHASFMALAMKYQPSTFSRVVKGTLNAGRGAATFFSPSAPYLLSIGHSMVNMAVYSMWKKPLSQIIYPNVCTLEPSLSNYPLEHVCYHAKSLVLDSGGHVLGLALFIKQYIWPGIVWAAKRIGKTHIH